MRDPTASFASLPPAFRAVWLATLGLLLAFHATVSTPSATAFSQDEWRVAKVTAATPLAAQFRESGQTVQIARATTASFKLHDVGDGNSPLSGKATSFAPPTPAANASHAVTATASGRANIRDAYRARAPPIGLHAA